MQMYCILFYKTNDFTLFGRMAHLSEMIPSLEEFGFEAFCSDFFLNQTVELLYVDIRNDPRVISCPYHEAHI